MLYKCNICICITVYYIYPSFMDYVAILTITRNAYMSCSVVHNWTPPLKMGLPPNHISAHGRIFHYASCSLW